MDTQIDDVVTLKDIKEAHERIKQYIHETPVLTNSTINKLSGDKEIFFKCENFQKVGAFKFRGACNSVFKLNEEDMKKGVVTHSSGNHGQALSLASKMRGVPCYVVVPENAPIVKLNAIKGYDANVTLCKATLEARETNTNALIEKHGCKLIHPFNNLDVIAGQGTAALELLEQVKDLDAVITPVGGGGLLSGTLISVKSINPNIKVFAAEPEGADDAFRSLKEGSIQSHTEGKPNTIADGLLTTLGPLNFPIIQKYIDGIITVSDDEIKSSMKLVWERMKIIIEPSSATVLAAIIKQNSLDEENKQIKSNIKRIGVIISGGNVDLSNISKILNI
ncbi:hypothetical protein DICPUDRAFT_89549 [Dictyostelium purpureum]|uniref:Tryptophan synthase beta chain-like PALP domain-containing protein n=1 Tax=Dictyostelium purpureum TaxID=5786 RepID=F0ZWJ2_DICPU|nr:uncharacterized protein DICPUDRAFT_89549 [Dictyostelium purpureum]EGC31693.1 hypothetical protein DICPUDRAFT_89549 [Dictyostelium purpureum]|eukprot:XP_003291791.1 hypothetical protein DICPUDRAFT_89549 [Dictyostelium purpureum]